ncbi:MAG: hypothetical protein K5851_03630 [Lachnospiraceae bacterium]|nr:hypothetical protein [Lachnospiraceae bacterium]
MNKKDNYNEYGLPDFLIRSIREYEEKKDTSLRDCVYSELQSDINVCETESIIPPSQAWYLRNKYLGIFKET